MKEELVTKDGDIFTKDKMKDADVKFSKSKLNSHGFVSLIRGIASLYSNIKSIKIDISPTTTLELMTLD